MDNLKKNMDNNINTKISAIYATTNEFSLQNVQNIQFVTVKKQIDLCKINCHFFLFVYHW